MICPKCRAEMEPVKVADIEVDRCRACGGMWFDLREHEHLKEIEGSEAIDTGDAGGGEIQDKNRTIDCPKCHTRMVSMAFPDQPHIHYEMCCVCHGLYLDAGEFKDYKEQTLSERIQYAFGHLFKHGR